MTDKKTLHIDRRECFIYLTEEGADTLLVQPVDDHDLEGMDTELDAIQKSVTMPFQLVAVKVNDWQTELTPWKAPAVFGKVPFGDQAPEMLRFITDNLLPEMTFKQVVLGGYSLAGLFALWSSYNTDVFQGIAAASPSVWYPDWISYVGTHTPHANSIYLSLGDKEEKAKNPVMARVGECIRRQYELLTQQNVKTIFEWNEGNHFRDADLRMAKGFAWVMNSI
ncbi:MAG: esterase [Bacteroidales bacterium]|nr:esterase [Bacteroidales bacterium]